MSNMSSMSFGHTALALVFLAIFIFLYFRTKKTLLLKRENHVPVQTWDKFIPCFSLAVAVIIVCTSLHELIPDRKGEVSNLTFLIDIIGLVFIVFGVRKILRPGVTKEKKPLLSQILRVIIGACISAGGIFFLIGFLTPTITGVWDRSLLLPEVLGAIGLIFLIGGFLLSGDKWKWIISGASILLIGIHQTLFYFFYHIGGFIVSGILFALVGIMLVVVFVKRTKLSKDT